MIFKLLGPLCTKHRDLMSQNPVFANTNLTKETQGIGKSKPFLFNARHLYK